MLLTLQLQIFRKNQHNWDIIKPKKVHTLCKWNTISSYSSNVVRRNNASNVVHWPLLRRNVRLAATFIVTPKYWPLHCFFLWNSQIKCFKKVAANASFHITAVIIFLLFYHANAKDYQTDIYWLSRSKIQGCLIFKADVHYLQAIKSYKTSGNVS